MHKEHRNFLNGLKRSGISPEIIFIFGIFSVRNRGWILLKNQYAASSDDSHPNYEFAERVAPLLVQRIVDVIEGRGDEGSLTGE